jgi:two-component system sensor histidine kinase TctE
MKESSKSLRRRLIGLVLWPALLVMVVGGTFGYLNARAAAQSTQDRLLLNTATSLAMRLMPDEGNESLEELRLHLREDDEALLKIDQVDEIRFLVLDAQSNLLAGDKALQPLLVLGQNSSDAAHRFANATLAGQPVRLLELWHIRQDFSNHVLVSSTTRKRDEDTRRMFVQTLLPSLLLLGFMLAAILVGITQSLRPLRQLGQAIDRRPDNDQTPIAQERLPLEVRPLIGAINRLLERQRRASKQQQLFLSSAAHQLRTPLAGVQAQLELAATGAPADLPARLARVREALATLSHCTQQMLALARSSEDASPAQEFAVVNLPDLLEEAASHWLDAALARQQTLEFDTTPAACTGSRWMLLELLNNLIDNAIKYSPEGARIGVRCGPLASGGAFLEVEDEGEGIAEAERAAMRRPFYRGDSAVAGSGLGLAIVGDVAARHGASLQLLDRQRGRGLRVRIEFVPGAASTRD